MASTPAKGLPAAVLDRPKTGFSVPVREWLSGRPATDGRHDYRDWAFFVYDRCRKAGAA
jgi:asparagine synthase (glutamine-hydrolysing)